MSKNKRKPSNQMVLNGPSFLETILSQAFNKDSFAVSSQIIESLVEGVANKIYQKELDLKCRPFSVKLTMSTCFWTSIVDFTQPDRKEDDIVFAEE